MDSVMTVKIVQRLIAEIAGLGMLVAGFVLIFRGITGKINLDFRIPGISAKLTNASPGIVISVFGIILIIYSMVGFNITKHTSDADGNSETVVLTPFSTLDQWLANCQSVTGTENYTQVLDKVVGTGPSVKLKLEYIKVHPQQSLSQISGTAYGNTKYWKLIAVANIGKGYFEYGKCNAETQVKDNSLIEVWKVSKYNGLKEEEIIKVSGADKKHAYKELMEFAHQNPNYNPLDHIFDLSDKYKKQELSLVQTPADYSGGIETIGDLSLKYYSDKELWPLIVWTNPKELKGVKDVSDRFPRDKTIYILHFIP